MKKLPFAILLIAILVTPLIYLSNSNLACAGTVPPSIIATDTVWTAANSPYDLSGPTLVQSGVTLTIQPGAVVNLNAYYLQVEGTLKAVGTNTNPIYINSSPVNAGKIKFTSFSNGWNEQTGTGCIIQNAVINQTVISITNSSVKITDNTFNDDADMMNNNVAIITSGTGSSIIANNHFNGGLDIGDNSEVLNNVITGGMGLYGGLPLVSKNTISGGSSYFFIGRSFDRNYNTLVIDTSAKVIDNDINGSVILNGYGDVSAQIIGNTVGLIMDGEGSVNLVISNNKCAGINLDSANSVTINNNLIFGSEIGIQVGNAKVKDNTIANCKIAIVVNRGTSPTLSGNNILNSAQYNLKLSGAENVDATNNWWGTTDQTAIGNSIYDRKNDFNLGTVTFVPFLTSPNPNAPPLDYYPEPSASPEPTAPPNEPTPTPAPSGGSTSQQAPTAAPSNPMENLLVIVVPIMAIIIAGLVVVIVVLTKQFY
ncbi:MAG: hypothetical protein NWE98_04205 [Candidatus Bathyarchaeota archaeon]|nr:hypothetical protein [Candidatus Bathyarchaeota archaeon]